MEQPARPTSHVLTRRRALLLGLAGVGAIPVVAKVRESADPEAARLAAVDLRNFGAVGDGVADDTAAVQALIDAAASDGAVAVLPAGRYRCTRSLLLPADARLHLEPGAHLLKDWAAETGLANAFLRNADFARKSNRVHITGGGTIGAVDHSRTGVVLAVYGDDVRLRDFTIDTYAGGQAIMFAGDRGRLDRLTIRNSPAAFGTGGIRMIGGEDFVATGCHVESGDDCLQFVPIGAPDALLYDMSIRNGSYVGCTGSSSAAHFMAAILEWTRGEGGMTASVSDCSFDDCHGTSSGRGINVRNVASSGAVRDVRFTDCSVEMTGGNERMQGIRVQSDATFGGPIRDVTFTRVQIRRPVGSTLRIGGPRVRNVTFAGCVFEPPTGAATVTAVANETDELTFRDCTFHGAPGKRQLVLGPAQAVTDVRVDGCRFDGIPSNTSAVNLVAANGARVTGSSFSEAGGATRAAAVRTTPAATGVVLRNNDCTGLTNPDAGGCD